MVEKSLCRAAYHPTRRMLKKRGGVWREVTEKLLPGYIFVETKDPGELYLKLKRVPRLTKFIDKDEDAIRPLPEKDKEWLVKMMRGKEGQMSLDSKLRNEVGLTLVEVEELPEDGNSGAKPISSTIDGVKPEFTTGKYRIRILEGPLENCEGKIKKIDLHRRRAEVVMEFMGQKTTLFMGIYIKE